MVSMAIPSRICTRESIERKAWTGEAGSDVFWFLAPSFGLVGAAIFLYSLGPALGMTLIAVGFAVWSFLRSQTASEEENDAEEYSGRAAAMDWQSRFADSAGMRSGRFEMSTAAAARAALSRKSP